MKYLQTRQYVTCQEIAARALQLHKNEEHSYIYYYICMHACMVVCMYMYTHLVIKCLCHDLILLECRVIPRSNKITISFNTYTYIHTYIKPGSLLSCVCKTKLLLYGQTCTLALRCAVWLRKLICEIYIFS